MTRGEVLPWLEAVRAMNPDLTFVDDPVLYVWADDPYALGGYSSWDPASWRAARCSPGRSAAIAFAGEHTAGEHHGTMEGALRSGRRAARPGARVARLRLSGSPRASDGSRPLLASGPHA